MSPYTQQFLNASGYTILQGSQGDIRFLLMGLIQIVLSLVAIIFFILIVYGGFLWLSAGGNEEQVTKAQQIIKSAVVGIVITLLSLMITRAVAVLVFQATTPTDRF